MKTLMLVLAVLSVAVSASGATTTPTPAASRSRKINTSKSNLRVQPTATPTPSAEGKPSKEQRVVAPTVTAGPLEGTPYATGTEDRKGHDMQKSSIGNVRARERATTVTPTPAARVR